MKTSRLAKTSGIALASSMLLMGALPIASAMAASKPAVMLAGPSDVNQTAGSNVTYTASSSNVSNPNYQFWVEEPNGHWMVAQNWSSSNTFTLKNVQDGDYLVTAYVAPKGDWKAATNEQANGQQAVDGVFVDTSITVSAPSTLTAGQPVTVTASSANIYDAQYQFWYKTPSGKWMQSGNYGSSSYTFTPSETGSYEFVAYAKSPLALNDPEGAAMSTNTATTAVGAAVPSLSQIGVQNASFGTGSESSPATSTNDGTMTLSTTLMDTQGNPVADTQVNYVFEDSSIQPTVTSSGSLSSSVDTQTSTYTYTVYTNANGVASVNVSDPGVSASYTVYASAPYQVNGSTLVSANSYLEFASGNSAAVSPSGSVTSSIGGVQPVTITLPPNSAGAMQSDVAVELTVDNTNASAYFTNSQGSADYTGTQTVYTNASGQATFYLYGDSQSGGTTTLTVNQPSDLNISSPTITWQPVGTASKLANSLSVSGATQSSNPSSLYSTTAGNQVTISGQVEDAAGNPVANASLIVVAASGNNGDNSYIQNGKTTAFPLPFGTDDDTVTGSPTASTSYGEMLTTDSSGNFSFTVTNSDTITGDAYAVYPVNDGVISTSSLGAVSIDWTNPSNITAIGLGNVGFTLPASSTYSAASSITNTDTSLSGLDVPVNKVTYVGVEPFAGTGVYTGTTSYTATMGASAVINKVYGLTYTGNSAVDYSALSTDEALGFADTVAGGNSSTASASVTVQTSSSVTVTNTGNTAVTLPNGASLASGDSATVALYTVDVNGQTITDVISPLLTLDVEDASAQASTLSVTANGATGTAAFTFENSTSNGYGDTTVTPSLDTLNPGQSQNFTVTVEDNSGNPIVDTMIPVGYSGISGVENTAATLWITGVNGVTLQTSNSSGGTEATPIPLGSGTTLGYGSVAIPGVATWSGDTVAPASGTFYAMSNASGIVTLSIANGNVAYYGGATTGNTVSNSDSGSSSVTYFGATSGLTLSGSNTNGDLSQIDW